MDAYIFMIIIILSTIIFTVTLLGIILKLKQKNNLSNKIDISLVNDTLLLIKIRSSTIFEDVNFNISSFPEDHLDKLDLRLKKNILDSLDLTDDQKRLISTLDIEIIRDLINKTE